MAVTPAKAGVSCSIAIAEDPSVRWDDRMKRPAGSVPPGVFFLEVGRARCLQM